MNSKKFQLALLVSMLIHVGIFTGLFYKSSTDQMKEEIAKPKNKIMQVKLIPPEMSMVSLEDKNKGAGNGAKICNGIKYTGVGLEWESKDNSVYKILPGGPAAQAGVKIHDILLNLDDYTANTKEAGSTIEFKVMREGVLLSLPARVDYICRGL